MGYETMLFGSEIRLTVIVQRENFAKKNHLSVTSPPVFFLLIN